MDVHSIEEILQETDLESDVDDENAKDTRSKVKLRKTKKFAGQRGKAWLKGRKEDASLDFLDTRVSRRVLGKKVIVSFEGMGLYSLKWGMLKAGAVQDPKLHLELSLARAQSFRHLIKSQRLF